jgi:hypothetical protein
MSHHALLQRVKERGTLSINLAGLCTVHQESLQRRSDAQLLNLLKVCQLETGFDLVQYESLYHALSSLQQMYTMQKKNWVFWFQNYAPFFFQGHV